jgi:ribosomal protein S18 acetylase RimI-like enzyme
MKRLFREIVAGDIDGLFALRIKVIENAITMARLAELGITPRSIHDALGDPLVGYLCEESGGLAGFAMGDLKSGEFAVIAVLPEYERQGIGRTLLKLVEDRLFAAGHGSIWLWTGPNRDFRALHFYRSAGWNETEVKGDRIYLKKDRPSQSPEPTPTSRGGAG